MTKIVPVGGAVAKHRPPQQSRSLLVDLLVVLFGVSSWVAVNGLWVELPVLVNVLPESWQLASYIVVTTQVANLGPVLFGAARRMWSQKVLEVPLIHASLALVIVSCALLSVFWERTSYVLGDMHSTALLVLTFFVSCVDCTSSLLYLPFIANFKEQYVISYLIGSGLSSPIPGFLALAQGVGGYPSCTNATTNRTTENGTMEEETHLVPHYAPPRFTPDIFFVALCLQMAISWAAFALLNHLPQAKRERVAFIPPVRRPKNPALAENFQSSMERDLSSSLDQTLSSEQNLISKPEGLPRAHNNILLAIQAFLSMILNGILLSVQTYSCLPYGNLAYHLTVTLSSIANPLCCFLAMFAPVANVRAVTALAVYVSVWSSYILGTAVLSPSPPLVGTTTGVALVVTSWVMVSGSVAYTKACIASLLRRDGGQSALYRCGVVTQVGSAAGAVTIFTLLQYTALFQSYTPCT